MRTSSAAWRTRVPCGPRSGRPAARLSLWGLVRRLHARFDKKATRQRAESSATCCWACCSRLSRPSGWLLVVPMFVAAGCSRRAPFSAPSPAVLTQCNPFPCNFEAMLRVGKAVPRFSEKQNKEGRTRYARDSQWRPDDMSGGLQASAQQARFPLAPLSPGCHEAASRPCRMVGWFLDGSCSHTPCWAPSPCCVLVRFFGPLISRAPRPLATQKRRALRECAARACPGKAHSGRGGAAATLGEERGSGAPNDAHARRPPGRARGQHHAREQLLEGPRL